MLMKRLFEGGWDYSKMFYLAGLVVFFLHSLPLSIGMLSHGVVVLATSNRQPEGLYEVWLCGFSHSLLLLFF